MIRIKTLIHTLALASIVFSPSCEKYIYNNEDNKQEIIDEDDSSQLVEEDNDSSILVEEDDDYSSPLYLRGVENALWKTHQLADIRWSPLYNLPVTIKNNKIICSYFKDKSYRGLPYSSVKELDCFVGLNISLHTFITSLKNPRSVIYTEDVNKAPYNGDNCGPYYGVVCSSSIDYILGLNAPFASRHLLTHPDFFVLQEQTIEKARICDILVNSGHVVMIYDIERDPETDKVSGVTIFEVTFLKKMSLDELESFWKEGKYTLMRYKKISQNVEKGFDELPSSDISSKSFDMALCTNKGDKASFRLGEKVVINILKQGDYNNLQLFNEKGLVATLPIKNEDIILDKLPVGLYKAKLISDNHSSDFTFFEVLDAQVKAIVTPENQVKVVFSSENAKPINVSLANVSVIERYSLQVLTKKEIEESECFLPLPDTNNKVYCKVVFKGKYGTVINEPVIIN